MPTSRYLVSPVCYRQFSVFLFHRRNTDYVISWKPDTGVQSSCMYSPAHAGEKWFRLWKDVPISCNKHPWTHSLLLSVKLWWHPVFWELQKYLRTFTCDYCPGVQLLGATETLTPRRAVLSKLLGLSLPRILSVAWEMAQKTSPPWALPGFWALLVVTLKKRDGSSPWAPLGKLQNWKINKNLTLTLPTNTGVIPYFGIVGKFVPLDRGDKTSKIAHQQIAQKSELPVSIN